MAQRQRKDQWWSDAEVLHFQPAKHMYSVDVLLNGGYGVFISTALCVKPIVCQFGILFASAMSILQLLSNAKTQDTNTMDLTSNSVPTSLRAAPYAAGARFAEKTRASWFSKGTGHSFWLRRVFSTNINEQIHENNRFSNFGMNLVRYQQLIDGVVKRPHP